MTLTDYYKYENIFLPQVVELRWLIREEITDYCKVRRSNQSGSLLKAKITWGKLIFHHLFDDSAESALLDWVSLQMEDFYILLYNQGHSRLKTHLAL